MTSEQKLKAMTRAMAYHREIVCFVSIPWRILEIRERNRNMEEAIGLRVWEEYYDKNSDWLSEFAE